MVLWSASSSLNRKTADFALAMISIAFEKIIQLGDIATPRWGADTITAARLDILSDVEASFSSSNNFD
jgi:hypothetical protein